MSERTNDERGMEARTTRQNARVLVELDREDLPHVSRYPPRRDAGHHVPQKN